MSKMKNSRQAILKILLNSIAPIIGIGCWGAYKLCVRTGWVAPLNLVGRKVEITTMISGFAYTTLGLLAAVLAILFSFTESEAFARYKRRGNLGVFMSLYIMSILSIVVTASLSLYNFSPRDTSSAFTAMLVLFAVNIVQTLLVCIVIYGIATKSIRDSH